MPPFRYLDLPAEIRNETSSYLWPSPSRPTPLYLDGPIKGRSSLSFQEPLTALKFLRTCKQIYREAPTLLDLLGNGSIIPIVRFTSFADRAWMHNVAENLLRTILLSASCLRLQIYDLFNYSYYRSGQLYPWTATMQRLKIMNMWLRNVHNSKPCRRETVMYRSSEEPEFRVYERIRTGKIREVVAFMPSCDVLPLWKHQSLDLVAWNSDWWIVQNLEAICLRDASERASAERLELLDHEANERLHRLQQQERLAAQEDGIEEACSNEASTKQSFETPDS